MTRFERFMVNLSTVITGLSGIVYAVMKYLLSSDDPFAVINHPWQPAMLNLHVLAGPAMIFGLGLIAQEHILAQLRRASPKQGRLSGMIALACVLPMVATGYLIQVASGEVWRKACVAIHLITGVLYLAAFVAHLIVAWRMTGRAPARMTAPATPRAPLLDN
jgi:hypothetical protein